MPLCFIFIFLGADGLHGSHHIAVMKLGQAGFMRETGGLTGCIQ